MSSTLYFTNAKVVTTTGTFPSSVFVEDGVIVHIGDLEIPENTETIDCDGDFLIPGLIELHTDNLEGEFQPRPGVLWPSPIAALYAHDATIIASGITTVLDSISCGQLNEGKMRHEMFTMSIDAITQGRKQGILRAEHFLHLRCELCDPYVLDMFRPHLEDPYLRLVSLMDHTPGQRQFCNMDKYKEYYKLEETPEDEFNAFVSKLQKEQAQFAEISRREIIELCTQHNVPLASHDDTTVEHVEEAVADGLQLSEFPTTIEAAEMAATKGLGIIMGAPNVVLNGSHSGNVSARLLAQQDLLHILSSDYVPVSLLHAAYILHSELGKELHDALATVTANPANFLGLHDRGEIAVDKRADLVRIKIIENTPVIRSVWREGIKVL